MDRKQKIKLLKDLEAGIVKPEDIKPRKLDIVWGDFDNLPEEHKGKFEEPTCLIDGKRVSPAAWKEERERLTTFFGVKAMSVNAGGQFGNTYIGPDLTDTEGHYPRYLPDHIIQNLNNL